MLLSLHGQSKDALAKTQIGAWEYDIVEPFYKCNMTDIMASLGIAQLKRYQDILNRREELIQLYEQGLKDFDVSYLKHYSDNYYSSGHLFLLRVNGLNEQQRNELIIKLAEEGISCNVHYKPLPMHSAYKKFGFKIEDFPNAFEMYQNEITLPLHTLLTEDDIKYITSQIISNQYVSKVL